MLVNGLTEVNGLPLGHGLMQDMVENRAS